MLSAAGVNSGAGRLRDCWYTSGGGAVRFYPMDPPTMSNRRSVRYLHKFRFGDTYQLKSRSWLLPQFLSGALTMCGVIFTLVGIICLQINKYLRRCDSDDGIHCKDNQAKINNVMMPIGVGSTGGGLTLILISGFIFVHAFCVIYDDTEHQEEAQQGVLHIPTMLNRDALGDSEEVLPSPPPTTATTPPPQLEVLPLELPPLGTPPPDADTDTDEDVKPDTDTDVKPDTDEDVKPDTDEDVKPDTDTDVKPDTDADVKPDTDADVKPDTDEDVKLDADASVNRALNRSQSFYDNLTD